MVYEVKSLSQDLKLRSDRVETRLQVFNPSQLLSSQDPSLSHPHSLIYMLSICDLSLSKVAKFL